VNIFKCKHWLGVLLVFCCLFWAVQSSAALSPQAGEYLRKARFFFERGDLKRARDFYQRAVRLDPNSPEIEEFGTELNEKINEKVKKLKQETDFYFSAKNIPKAEEILQQLMVLAPNDKYSQEKLAEIKQINQKIEEYKSKGIKVAPSSGRSHDIDHYSAISYLNRARGFLSNGDRENALLMVEKVLKREPHNKEALEIKEQIFYVNKIQEFIENAESAFAEGKMQESVTALNQLIHDSPSRTEFLLLRAKALLKLKRYEKAEADLWRYYNFHPDPKTLYPIFSQLYAGMGRYDIALGFAGYLATAYGHENFGQRIRFFVNHYKIEVGMLCLLFALLPFVIYFAYHQLDLLINRFPPGGFTQSIYLFIAMHISRPALFLPQLIETARGLNTAWLNYFAAICLFQAEQFEGAQRFLAFSFSNDHLAGRAYYFYGLSRRLLGQKLSTHDFEEAVLSALSNKKKGWHPKFMKKIEHELILNFGKKKDEESFEGLAYQLITDQLGEM
jgi:tetratricopeptide (TPR) repeat protein